MVEFLNPEVLSKGCLYCYVGVSNRLFFPSSNFLGPRGGRGGEKFEFLWLHFYIRGRKDHMLGGFKSHADAVDC